MSDLNIIMIVIVTVLFTLFLIWALGIPFSYFLGIIGMVDNKDPLEGKCDGLSSTIWESDCVCTRCLSFVSHKEEMTGICLSCGERFNFTRGSVATRVIMHKGKWVRQLNLNGKIYLDKVLFEKEK